MALEKERKFLVKFPSSWIQFTELLDNIVDIKRISQTYLKKEPDQKQSGRVRKTVAGLSGDKETVYHYNEKKFVEKGVNEEFEKEISKAEYDKLLKNREPDQDTLNKTRFLFEYDGLTYELDLFKDDLKGLAILEVELKDIDQKIDLPPFLKIEKEVTGNKNYNNYNLASKSFKKSVKNGNKPK